jgi:hypothetical protein
MTESAQETEKPATKGRVKAKTGATFFSFSGYAAIGALIGAILAVTTSGEGKGQPYMVALLILVPLIIGILLRTTSDKEITWYKNEARTLGAILGLVLAYAAF